MVLLDILRRSKLAEWVVVHVNHGLRSSAQRDEKLVRNYCERWGIKLIVKSVDVSKHLGAKGGGIEEVARELRYKALRAAAKEAGATIIILAHTADDQAETVLFNWLRGSSLRGWGGILEVSDDLWRPLLTAPKSDLLNHAKAKQVPFVKDESNDSLQFTRNRIRKTVLPVLQQINPVASEQILRNAAMARQAERAVRDLARLYLLAIAKPERGKMVLDRSRLMELTEFMRAEVIKLAVETLAPNLVEWSGAKFGQIAKLMASAEPTATKVIGRTLVVATRYDKITLSLKR